MKTQFNVHLEVEAVDWLRTRARELGVPISALTELCVRVTRAQVKEESLRAWAKKELPPKLGRPSTAALRGSLGMSTQELKVLVEIRHMLWVGCHYGENGSWFFTAEELSGPAGLTRAVTARALLSLHAKGFIERTHPSWDVKYDRWSIPAQLSFCTPLGRELNEVIIKELDLARAAELTPEDWARTNERLFTPEQLAKIAELKRP